MIFYYKYLVIQSNKNVYMKPKNFIFAHPKGW